MKFLEVTFSAESYLHHPCDRTVDCNQNIKWRSMQIPSANCYVFSGNISNIKSKRYTVNHKLMFPVTPVPNPYYTVTLATVSCKLHPKRDDLNHPKDHLLHLKFRSYLIFPDYPFTRNHQYDPLQIVTTMMIRFSFEFVQPPKTNHPLQNTTCPMRIRPFDFPMFVPLHSDGWNG